MSCRCNILNFSKIFRDFDLLKQEDEKIEDKALFAGNLFTSTKNYPEFSCTICQRTFRIHNSLKKHLQRTHRPKILTSAKCDRCDKIFKTGKVPPRHFIFCGSRLRKEHICEYCGMTLATRNSYFRHVLGHTGELPHSCNVCEKKFKSTDKLKIHSRTHTGEKPYICKYCNRGFGTQGTLIAHIRTHTKERPFKCNVCEKGFTQGSALRTHRLQHVSNKPFECKTCKLVFATRNLLKSHDCIAGVFSNAADNLE